MIDCFTGPGNNSCYSIAAWKTECVRVISELDYDAFSATQFATFVGLAMLLPSITTITTPPRIHKVIPLRLSR